MEKKFSIPMQPVTSSQLKEIGYDAATQTLAIRFHAKKGPGSLYTYANVPPAVYDGFKAADADAEQSVGKYFGEHIKPKADIYPYARVIEDAPEAR